MASALALETAGLELVPATLPVHEAAEAFARAVEFRMRAYRENADDARRALTINVDTSQIASLPADKVTMRQLALLIDAGEVVAAEALWERICRHAEEELASGSHAASVVAGAHDGTPQGRARFLVLRERLRRDWQPSTELEGVLLDQMVQVLTALDFWTSAHFKMACSGTYTRDEGAPRIGEQDSIEHTALMVERFNRMFIRLVRSLRDLRRLSAPRP